MKILFFSGSTLKDQVEEARECSDCEREVFDPNESHCADCLFDDAPYRPKQPKSAGATFAEQYKSKAKASGIAA